MQVCPAGAGPQGRRRSKAATERATVLAVVDSVSSGRRLMEVVRLVEGDARVRVFFTVPAGIETDLCVRKFLCSVGALVVPWSYATRHPFTLALAAGSEGVGELTVPTVLMTRRPAALDATPSATLALAHAQDRAVVARTHPDAAADAQVVGDADFDRLSASSPYRDAYRWALRVLPHQSLIVVATTESARLPDPMIELPARLASALPRAGYRIAVLAHSDAWYGPMRRRMALRLSEGLREGFHVVAPDSDWCAVLTAADLVISDFGLFGPYAAAAGASVAFGAPPCVGPVESDSALTALADLAPRMTAGEPLAKQLAKFTEACPRSAYAGIAARITSRPGRFAKNMRRLVYRRLGMAEPASQPAACPAPPPSLISRFTVL